MKIKKIVAAFSMLSIMIMPSVGLAQTPTVVGTGLTKGVGGNAPIIKAKWEMNGPVAAALVTGGTAADDYPALQYSQFNPPMTNANNKTISICGVVYDTALTDVHGVYGDVYYPDTTALGPNHPADRQGCGTMLGSECTMVAVGDKNVAWDLFCSKVRNNNTGALPLFAANESFDTICNEQDGWIKKDVAMVYCCDKTISYEDPSGVYDVDVWAQSNGNATSDKLSNEFLYQEGTALQADFTSIAYGPATLGNWVTLPGNVTFLAGDGRPTVRNVGNTRLTVAVAQDDMGMNDRDVSGTTTWNVHYRAKVSTAGTYTSYDPIGKKSIALAPTNNYTALNLPINLSSDDEVDFGVMVDKFETAGPFTGKLWLEGQAAAHLTDCSNIIPATHGN